MAMGQYITEACVRNKRKDKDLERQLEKIDAKRDRSLKNIHLQTVEVMKQQDDLRYSQRKLDNYDISMHTDDLVIYNSQRNQLIKDRKKSKMDPYSNLSIEPVDKMRVPKSYYVDSAGIVELGSCNGQVLKVKKWLLKCSEDYRWIHTTSGEHYQLKKMADE